VAVVDDQESTLVDGEVLIQGFIYLRKYFAGGELREQDRISPVIMISLNIY